MVGYVKRSHCTEENGVKGLQLIESAVGNVDPGFQILVRVPFKIFEFQRETGPLRECVQYFNACCDDFRPNAISRYCCNFVGTHNYLLRLENFQCTQRTEGSTRVSVKYKY
ncbi:hypothetical protein D3C80_562600 [compost metagenome]